MTPPTQTPAHRTTCLPRLQFRQKETTTRFRAGLTPVETSHLSNPDLKLICFLSLSANYSTYLFHQRLCSRLTALWRYINFVLLLLLLLPHAALLSHQWLKWWPSLWSNLNIHQDVLGTVDRTHLLSYSLVLMPISFFSQELFQTGTPFPVQPDQHHL